MILDKYMGKISKRFANSAIPIQTTEVKFIFPLAIITSYVDSQNWILFSSACISATQDRTESCSWDWMCC